MKPISKMKYFSTILPPPLFLCGWVGYYDDRKLCVTRLMRTSRRTHSRNKKLLNRRLSIVAHRPAAALPPLAQPPQQHARATLARARPLRLAAPDAKVSALAPFQFLCWTGTFVQRESGAAAECGRINSADAASQRTRVLRSIAFAYVPPVALTSSNQCAGAAVYSFSGVLV